MHDVSRLAWRRTAIRLLRAVCAARLFYASRLGEAAMVGLVIALVLAAATAASAQTTTFRNSQGQITGTATKDSNGQITFRDRSGRTTGTATPTPMVRP